MNIMSIVESGQDLNFGLGTKVNNQNASYIFFITKIINRTFIMYRIVASRSTSRLVTCLGLFRLLMKGIFGPYVLWPLNKKLIFWIVTRVSARDYTVLCTYYLSFCFFILRKEVLAFFNHPALYVRTFSVHKVRENCLYLLNHQHNLIPVSINTRTWYKMAHRREKVHERILAILAAQSEIEWS